MELSGSTQEMVSPLNSVPPSQEKKFILNGFVYAAQLWDNARGVDDAALLPVIMLHGWLDNSASFNVLAPQLKGRQCLAIDLAGHGFSDHKSGWADYPLWSEVSAVYAIADQMGWDEFILIGHSRGAMMALITAGTFPKRIAKLVFIDSLIPPTVSPNKAVERMQKSLGEIKQRIERKQSLYPNYNAAIQARCNSRYAPVTIDTAKVLATRGLQEVGKSFHWHADGKLWAASNVALSQEMVDAFADHIIKQSIPSLLLMGNHGLITVANAEAAFVDQCLTLAQRLSADIRYYDDGHFLHIEAAAHSVAKDIQLFLED